MVVCRDCGTRNQGAEYCRRCGASLYVKRQPQSDRLTRFVRHLFVRK
ncbi:MAG: hypothetical protein IMX01_03460 [Limnochordaceae bacterium]|nr:hypothetical protein [Limnochordaceae bacterium]